MDHSSEPPGASDDSAVADLTDSVQLGGLLDALHERYSTAADVPVGVALAEFVDVVDLAALDQPAPASTTTR